MLLSQLVENRFCDENLRKNTHTLSAITTHMFIEIIFTLFRDAKNRKLFSSR